MSDYSFLRPGLRWAREKRSYPAGQESAWCIVEFTGNSPFLETRIIYHSNGPVVSGCMLDPDNWQFGPEIDTPSKDWAEVREMPREK